MSSPASSVRQKGFLTAVAHGLGLDLVGVQAKRYDREAAVQRPEMQAFVGALQDGDLTRNGYHLRNRDRLAASLAELERGCEVAEPDPIEVKGRGYVAHVYQASTATVRGHSPPK